MLRKHGVGRHNACSALSSMPRAVVWAILGLGLGVAPGQSAAGSVVYIGKVLWDRLKTGPEACWQVDTFSGHLTGTQTP